MAPTSSLQPCSSTGPTVPPVLNTMHWATRTTAALHVPREKAAFGGTEGPQSVPQEVITRRGGWGLGAIRPPLLPHRCVAPALTAALLGDVLNNGVGGQQLRQVVLTQARVAGALPHTAAGLVRGARLGRARHQVLDEAVAQGRGGLCMRMGHGTWGGKKRGGGGRGFTPSPQPTAGQGRR
jgi:hypothetical protein